MKTSLLYVNGGESNEKKVFGGFRCKIKMFVFLGMERARQWKGMLEF